MLNRLVGQHKIIIIIFLVSLCLRLLTFGLLDYHYGSGSYYLGGNESSLDGNDTQHYVIIANNLSKHGVYSRFVSEPLESDSLRTPLLPLYFLPFIHYLGFNSLWLAMLLLVIIVSAIPVVAYYLAQLFLDKFLSLVVGLAVATQPLMIYFSSIAEPDMLMVLFFLLVIYQFCLYYFHANSKNLFIAAGLLGLMTLAKPVGIYVFLILVVFIIIKNLKIKHGLKQLGLFIFIFILILSPWLYRNYKVFGVVDVSAIKSTNLYLYYTVGFEKTGEILPADSGEREPAKNIKYQKAYVKLSLDRILNQPLSYAKTHLIGTLRSMLSGDTQEVYHKGHENILPFVSDLKGDVDLTESLVSGNIIVVIRSILSNINLLFRYTILVTLYFLALIGWGLSFRRNKNIFILFTLFLILAAYFFVSSGVFVSPKYRLPIMPLLFIMALYAISKSKPQSMKKNKILIATGTYLPEVSGQSTFVSNFKKNLPVDFELIIVAYGDKKEVRDGNIYIIKRNIFRYLNYYLTVRKLSQDASIIYAQDLVSSGLPAALAKRKNNCLIVRIGGDFLWEKMVNSGQLSVPVSQYYDLPKNKLEKFYLAIYRYVLNKSDKLIFNTPWPTKWYKIFFNLPDHKIEIIQNPFIINNHLISSIGDEIIYAGRFIPLKNLKRLIEAFKLIKTAKKLVLIGDGPDYNALRELAATDGRISIIGKMDQSSLWQRIAQSYLFILPSISEFNPNVAMEALNIHKPVILTKEVGLNEDLKLKFELIDPLDVNSIKEKIEFLLDINNYNKSLNNLLNNNLSYDWSQVMAQHLKLFSELVDQINILNIGTDKGLAGGPVIGDAIERHRKYGEMVTNLDIIVYSHKRDNLSHLKIASNVTGHGTNSRSKLFFMLDAIKLFKKINKHHRINIVVCQDPFLPGLIGLFLKIFYGVKLQINFHGDFWQNKNWLRERPINFLFLIISKLTVPYADAVRVMSDGQREKLGRYKNKARVISTPVDISKFIAHSLKQNIAKIVLHVGRDDQVKDYDTLVKAFKLIAEKISDVKFWQVGADAQIKSAMQDNNFFEVVVKGLKSSDELINVYQESDILVLTSASESFGKVLIEANAAGKPVVATATTGAKEIIKNDYNGYLVPIGDFKTLAEKVIYLLEHPEQAKIMGEHGKKLVLEKYGSNNEKIIKLWQDIIANKI